MRRQIATLLCYFLPLFVGVVTQDDLNRERPCESDNAISLPRDKKCLVPVKTAYTWANAAATCERSGGTLFQAPDSLLASRPDLMRCLTAMVDLKTDDMWIKAFGVWSPHFTWTNKSSVNQVDYCPTTKPEIEYDIKVNSESLSVDYCILTCQQENGSQFTIYFNNSKNLECYCRHTLPPTITVDKCSTTSVNTTALGRYYILQTKEDSLIKINSNSVMSRTESLCATVDSNTLTERKITSDMCFTGQHFICDLGGETKCQNTACSGTECRFIVRHRCLVRVSLTYNWWAARAYCLNLTGDLWNMYKLNDLSQVPMLKAPAAKYWIGATNYDWRFDAHSASLGDVPVNVYNWVRCGHMKKVTPPGQAAYWEWSGTDCQQQKAFLCEFAQTTFTAGEIQSEVTCPTPIDPIDPNIPGTTRPPTDNPTSTPKSENGGVLSGSAAGDSFPIAAVIAAIIAGLILLTCLALTFAFCSRRRWMAGRFKKAREHLSFIPYFADVSGADYDSHANMSSVSDHGSQIGLIKGGYHNGTGGYGMSTSYGEQSGAFSSKSLDRRQKDTMDRKLAESKNYLISGNSSMDERGFSATYNTLPNRPRDFMTLQAQMDIKDEVELAAMRGSLRNKPEVALVTDNVDMNFTVNHAVSRVNSHNGSELSRSSLERTMEEIMLPASEGGMRLNLPERVAEESRLHSTMTRNYHGI